MKPLSGERFSSHGWDIHSKGENLVGSVPAADAVISGDSPDSLDL
jgi:hypothetical protein